MSNVRSEADLIVERKGQEDQSEIAPGVMLTPPVGEEDYWAYRVVLSEKQALVGFPKFGTIGIGFANEEDWNSNLPWTTQAERTLVHICHNKGDDTISDELVLEAIRLIQDAVAEDRDTTLLAEIARRDEWVTSQGRTPEPDLTTEEALTRCAEKRAEIAREMEEDQ